ncbi:MAG: 7-cyano-7-deazaguanine synthase QueC [Nitrospirota bacterium]
MKTELAVVLVSGGMDSCVAAALANEHYRLACLHVNYGQRTEARELRAFHELAEFYQAEKRLVVSIEHLKVIGGSALTDASIPVPVSGSMQSAVPTTYVPFRNAHLLAIAVSWAEVIGATRIYIGAVEEDSSGYPDCREVFYQAFNKVIETGTKPETRAEIITPLIHMNKSAIVRKGAELGAPLHLTWSCYQNSERACGRCESCALRLKGFREAGVKDPIPYEE